MIDDSFIVDEKFNSTVLDLPTAFKNSESEKKSQLDTEFSNLDFDQILQSIENSKNFCQTQNVEFKCHLCNFVGISKVDLRFHKDQFHCSEQCQFCHNKFESKKVLEEHINKMHKKSGHNRKFRCSFCNFTFGDLKSCQNHQKDCAYEIGDKSKKLTSTSLRQFNKTGTSKRFFGNLSSSAIGLSSCSSSREKSTIGPSHFEKIRDRDPHLYSKIIEPAMPEEEKQFLDDKDQSSKFVYYCRVKNCTRFFRSRDWQSGKANRTKHESGHNLKIHKFECCYCKKLLDREDYDSHILKCGRKLMKPCNLKQVPETEGIRHVFI